MCAHIFESIEPLARCAPEGSNRAANTSPVWPDSCQCHVAMIYRYKYSIPFISINGAWSIAMRGTLVSSPH